jgi:hypothetical protein
LQVWRSTYGRLLKVIATRDGRHVLEGSNLVRCKPAGLSALEVGFIPRFDVGLKQVLHDERGLNRGVGEQVAVAPQPFLDPDDPGQERISHDGDTVLAAHVAAGTTKDTERGWRLVKGRVNRPVDALIAMMIAYGPTERLGASAGGFEWV